MKHLERHSALIVLLMFLIYSAIVGWSTYLVVVSSVLAIIHGLKIYLQAQVEKTELQDKISNLEKALNYNVKNIGLALEDIQKQHNTLKNDVSKFTIQKVDKPSIASNFRF